jgi:hypothetical protein
MRQKYYGRPPPEDFAAAFFTILYISRSNYKYSALYVKDFSA